MLNVNLDEVRHIESKQKAGRFALEKKGGAGWSWRGRGRSFSADDNAINALRGRLFHLRAERLAALRRTGRTEKVWTGRAVNDADLDRTDGGGKAGRTCAGVGRRVEGEPGQRYARLDRGPGVAVLTAADAALLSRTHLDYVDHKLLSFPAERVTSSPAAEGNRDAETVKKEGDWQLVKPQEQHDDATLAMLVRQLANLRATSIAAYPLTDEKKYGLDAPAALLTIHLTGADGKPAKHAIALGREMSVKSGQRFARVDGGKAVAVLPAALSGRLLAVPLAFRNRDLAQFSDADRIVLERSQRKATFARVGGNWTLTAQTEAKVDNDRLEEFLGRAARLKAAELVADKPSDLRQYRLETPVARWRFARRQGRSRSARRQDRPVRQTPLRPPRQGHAGVPARRRSVEKDAGRIPRAHVWSTPLDAAQVETLKLAHGDKVLLLKHAGGDWKVEGKPDVKVNAETVNDTLAALTGLKLDHYAVDKGADFKLFGLEPPQRIVEAEWPGAR